MKIKLTTRRIWLALLLGVVGYGAAWWLFARYSPARNWQARLDRTQAVALTQRWLEQLGYRADDRFTLVEGVRGEQPGLRQYLQQQPAALVRELFTPTQMLVSVRLKDEQEQTRLRFNSNGQLLSFRLRSIREGAEDGGPPARGNPGSVAQPITQLTPAAADKTLAEELFRLHFAPFGVFQANPSITHNEAGYKFLWTGELPNEPRVRLLASTLIKEGRLQTLELRPHFTERFVRLSPTSFVLDGFFSVLVFLVIAATVLNYFVAWGNGKLHHRLALLLAAGVALWLFGTGFLSGLLDHLTTDIQHPSATFSLLLILLLKLLFTMGIALPVYFFFVTGLALIGEHPTRRTVGMEQLLRGHWQTRLFGASLVAGIGWGGLLAALPLLVAALFARGQDVGATDYYDIFGGRLPWLGAAPTGETLSIFTLFTILLPLTQTYLKRLAIPLTLLIGTVWLAEADTASHQANVALLIGLSLTSLLLLLYFWHDLVAVLIAALVSPIFLHALALWAQPNITLQRSGILLCALLVTGLLVGLQIFQHGAHLPAEAFAPLHTNQSARVERERLKAELEVATRAQTQMLPQTAPAVPGLEIVASCHPSKDVGGDLFDFLPLSDGRIGFVVADVSGKGVPAALYMTLTKGLLAASSTTYSDPGMILREINRHLYEACRKKVFVTLFLAVYDPATRQLTYARAGHNPAVYYSATQQAASLLRPAGMGLGLNQGKLFDQSLKVATLQLTSNDILCLYSDGITEAMNQAQEEYGEERLMTTLQRWAAQSAHALHDAIAQDVKEFLGPLAPQDDQTLVVLRVA